VESAKGDGNFGRKMLIWEKKQGWNRKTVSPPGRVLSDRKKNIEKSRQGKVIHSAEGGKLRVQKNV